MRDLGLAARAQQPRIRAEHGERRFKSMREVARACPGALDRLVLGVEEGVDLLGKRRHFVGVIVRQPGARARPDGPDPAAHCFERTQPDPNLQPGRNEQGEAEQGERRGEIAGESPGGGADIGAVDGDRDAYGPSTVCGRIDDRALPHDKRRMAGAR